MIRRQEYAVFYSPGTMFAEQTSRPIENRDLRAAVAIGETIVERYSARPYGFRFETRIVADPIPDGVGGTLAVASKTIDTSGLHFLGGRLETIDDVAARADKREETLLWNMRVNDHPIVCITENGFRSTQPFGATECIVDAAGEIVERGDDPRHVTYRAHVAARPREGS